MSDPTDNVSDLFDAQIEQQGTACVRVKDGQLFIFTRETLETLLERSKECGRVAVLVKRGAEL